MTHRHSTAASDGATGTAARAAVRSAPRTVSQPPKDEKARQQDLTRRLRAALAERPLERAEMGATLNAEEELVLVALRRLGKKKRGRLRSGCGRRVELLVVGAASSGPGRPGRSPQRPLTHRSRGPVPVPGLVAVGAAVLVLEVARRRRSGP